jgi:hypothetical protein
MSVQTSVAVVIPLAMLSACGNETPTKHSPRMTTTSAWDCHLSLVRPKNDKLRKRLSAGTGISIYEDKTDKTPAEWYAFGHLDGRMHFTADSAFPVRISGDESHPVLEWKIHELDVRAAIKWKSARREEGEIELDAFLPDDAPISIRSLWGNVSTFRMRGNCERDRKAEAALNTGNRS